MASLNQDPLAEALSAIETGVAKPVQAPRLTYAQARAALASSGFDQVATFTDINGVERQAQTPVRVYGGQPVVMLMAAE